MILTITSIIFSLVIVNLLLLKFSSNKVMRSSTVNKKPIILHPNTPSKDTKVLAATGS